MNAIKIFGTLILSLVALNALPLVSQEKSTLLRSLEEEVTRSMKVLAEKGDPAPYFIGYDVTETNRTNIAATYGALRESRTDFSRMLDVDVRVGDYQLDNSRQLRGDRSFFAGNYSHPVSLPIEDNPDAIKSMIWLKTDQHYRSAVERLIQINANRAVSVEEQDSSADFSRETGVKQILPLASMNLDRSVWEEKIRKYSNVFTRWPKLTESFVSMQAVVRNKYTTNSEGSSLQHGTTHARLFVYATTKASDGEELFLYRLFDAHTLDGLPSDAEIEEAIDILAAQLMTLREAPFVEAYTGPAILSGRAAGVYFHETLGHRLEGHRQKDESGGQTFTKKVNEKILPDFISIHDDPTARTLQGIDLNGYYQFDDEGVAAQRVPVVENGVLKNFLMSRSPVEGFTSSNGHGRKSPGRKPVGRQGNFIVSAGQTVSEERLREMLIEECKKQGKPYGLRFEEIAGGFTYVGRYIPQFFKVTPIVVWRVYADGRPDELVRGVDLIGTPLTSLSQILACGDQVEVFNGVCGAESGLVPVSAVSPSFLTAQVEVQKKAKSSKKPPVLPAPDDDDSRENPAPGGPKQ